MTTGRDWNRFARENPDAPLSPEDAQDYLGHLVDSHNDHVRELAAREQARKEWFAKPWWHRTLLFFMAP